MSEDYFECLHHKKEHDMVRTVIAQQKKNEELALSEGGDGGHWSVLALIQMRFRESFQHAFAGDGGLKSNEFSLRKQSFWRKL